MAAQPIPDSPRTFGYKMCWLCVRSNAPEAVATAISLRALRPCTWAEGVEERTPFVSPPLEGWSFVLWVLDFGDIAAGRTEALRLSRVLNTEVCFFHSDRVVDGYAFVRAQSGVQLRAFGTEDGVSLFDEGTPSAFEGLPPGAADGVDPLEAEMLAAMAAEGPNEDTVLMVAGDWCLDPSDLGWGAPGLGLSGR